jgi:hypothetical protein
VSSDFRTFYRLCHASRFVLDAAGQCVLESFYQQSMTAGVKVGENLRKNVKLAMEALSNGFLNDDLIDKLIVDEKLRRKYYSEILIVIYRLLFLLFAEQRAMLPARDSLYADEYSITKLREIGEQVESGDYHCDLWHGLKITQIIIQRLFCMKQKICYYHSCSY